MSEISDGHAAEEYLPDNARRHRERQNLSQAAVAKAMHERGWPWHQQTVYRIETGKQTAGFGEITDLARILGVSADRLARPGPEETAVALTDRASWLLTRSWREAVDAIERLFRDHAGAGRAVEVARESKYERVRQVAEELAAEMEVLTPQRAADEALARFDGIAGMDEAEDGDGGEGGS